MKVIWSDEAAWALADLEEQLSERFSPTKAAEVVIALVRRVDLLAANPELGRVVPEYELWQLRELVDAHNRVLYRLRASAIEVVTIVPTRMPLGPLDDEG